MGNPKLENEFENYSVEGVGKGQVEVPTNLKIFKVMNYKFDNLFDSILEKFRTFNSSNKIVTVKS